ncbi:transcription factor IIIA-like [Oppia nitens]|uniref:transcription factor IIIA-like n=1 Tax=Oppia nitens TaxID=1686743 RepID=UPI0023DA39D2|nr:transcription factor IIIA-like [Oppia nitens]
MSPVVSSLVYPNKLMKNGIHLKDNEYKDVSHVVDQKSRENDSQSYQSKTRSGHSISKVESARDDHTIDDKGLKNEEILSTSEECYDSTINSYICPQNDCHKSFDKLKTFSLHRKTCKSKKKILKNIEKSQEVKRKENINETDEEINAKQEYYDSTTNLYNCPQINCEKSYKSLKIFLTHRKKCVTKKIVNLKHKKQVYDRQTGLLMCRYNDCDKKFNSKSGVRCHEISSHETDRTKWFKCEYTDCQFDCLTRCQMKSHVYYKHSDIKSFKCPISGCNKALKSKNSLELHLMVHNNIAVSCDFPDCKRKFRTHHKLKRHLAIHMNEPTLQCPVDGCDEKFFTDSEIFRHRILVHNKQRVKYKSVKRKCDWPGCDYFGKALTDHKTVHTGVKKYVCLWPQCGKQFRTKYKLDLHMNIHNNFKPFACRWPGCEYRCAHQSNISKHMKQVHQKL